MVLAQGLQVLGGVIVMRRVANLVIHLIGRTATDMSETELVGHRPLAAMMVALQYQLASPLSTRIEPFPAIRTRPSHDDSLIKGTVPSVAQHKQREKGRVLRSDGT